MTAVFTIAVPTVSSMGELPSGLPWLTLPGIPLNLETLQTIAPYALGLALVGLLESLMKFVVTFGVLVDVPPHRQCSVRCQRFSDLRNGDPWVDPVESGGAGG